MVSPHSLLFSECMHDILDPNLGAEQLRTRLIWGGWMCVGVAIFSWINYVIRFKRVFHFLVNIFIKVYLSLINSTTVGIDNERRSKVKKIQKFLKMYMTAILYIAEHQAMLPFVSTFWSPLAFNTTRMIFFQSKIVKH